jgi:hypothetical protein
LTAHHNKTSWEERAYGTFPDALLLYRNASWLFALEHLDQLIEGNIKEDLLDENNDWSSMVGYDFSTDGDDSSVVSELD